MSELHLFDAYGIELEYMIVDDDTLSVLPVADRILEAAAGRVAADVDMGATAWSNELVRHVIEFKTNGPAQSLEGLNDLFAADVVRANDLARRSGACLMPTGAHPWMDPLKETEIWPHEYNDIYRAYHRIFDCTGHGWSNLQSMHVNLPFCGDEEFGRLHAAIRLILPLMPALAASTPVLEGQATGLLDSRMDHYRRNSQRVPSVAGLVVPEPAYTRKEYEKTILKRMYKDIGRHDKEGLLKHEWLNARGAIARFDRGAIEIRVLDTQECPAADLAVAALVVAAVRATANERFMELQHVKRFSTEALAVILAQTIEQADAALITDAEYLRALGMVNRRACRAGEIWLHLTKTALPTDHFDAAWTKPLEVLLTHGSLSRRILAALGGDTRREHLREVYARLCHCLAQNIPFIP